MVKSPSRSKKSKEQQQEPKAAPKPVVDEKGSSKPSMENKSMSIIEYTEDLSNAEAPVPLPASDYPAEIRAAERKTSPRTGNDYINVTFFISADAYPPDYTDGDPDGTILSYGRLSPDATVKARYGMKKFCEAIGAELGRNVDLNDWIGKTAIVTVTNGEYEGQPTANISKVNPA